MSDLEPKDTGADSAKLAGIQSDLSRNRENFGDPISEACSQPKFPEYESARSQANIESAKCTRETLRQLIDKKETALEPTHPDMLRQLILEQSSNYAGTPFESIQCLPMSDGKIAITVNGQIPILEQIGDPSSMGTVYAMKIDTKIIGVVKVPNTRDRGTYLNNRTINSACVEQSILKARSLLGPSSPWNLIPKSLCLPQVEVLGKNELAIYTIGNQPVGSIPIIMEYLSHSLNSATYVNQIEISVAVERLLHAEQFVEMLRIIFGITIIDTKPNDFWIRPDDTLARTDFGLVEETTLKSNSDATTSSLISLAIGILDEFPPSGKVKLIQDALRFQENYTRIKRQLPNNPNVDLVYAFLLNSLLGTNDQTPFDGDVGILFQELKNKILSP